MAHLTVLTIPLLLTLTSAIPGADPLADAYALALAADTSDPNSHNDPNGYDQSSSYGGSASDANPNVDAGASGSSGGFKLSNGAIAAIAVVCALVVIFGIASVILFYVAKKRQWQVRKTLAHTSRRVTARVTGKKLDPKEQERLSKRKGAVRLQEEYKRDRNQQRGDVEKGGAMEMKQTRVEGGKHEKRAVAVHPPA